MGKLKIQAEVGITIGSDHLVNRTDICILINTTPATLEKWVKNGLLRHKRTGSKFWMYSISEVLRFRIEWEQKLQEDEIQSLRDRIAELKEPDSDVEAEYRMRDLKAKAEMNELKLELRRNELVSFTSVMDSYRSLGLLFRHHVEDSIKRNSKIKKPVMNIVKKFNADILREINKYENEYKSESDQPEDQEFCVAKTKKGKPCSKKAKRENLCMIHWNQLKMK